MLLTHELTIRIKIQIRSVKKIDNLQYWNELRWKSLKHKNCRKLRYLSIMIGLVKNGQVTNLETLKQAAA